MLIRKYGSLTITSPDNFESGGIHPYHHEILYISEGQVQLYWYNRIFTATGPALFFLTPNTPHLMVKVSEHCSYLFMEVDMQQDPFLDHEEILQWNAMQPSKQPGSGMAVSVYETMVSIRHHLESSQSHLNRPFVNKLIRLEIQKVVLFVQQIVAEATATSDENLIDRQHPNWETKTAIEMLAHYMECYYQDNITLRDLADFAHLNPSYLIRLFKMTKGITPFQYLNNVRMNAALGYLSNTDLSIQDIVEITGYQSIHYFSRVFKMQHGESPTLWRKNNIRI